MDDATIWWIAAGLLVAAELTTGSIYLLMLAIGAAAGAIAAHLGLGATAEVAIAALTGGLGTAGWYLYRRRQGREVADVQADRNVNLDVGQTVEVSAWDEHGRAQVHYRGANWTARYVGNTPAQPGLHRIAKLDGNLLELDTH